MLFLYQLTSSLLYDLIFVIVFTAAMVALFGSLAARERRKTIRKLPKIEGINRAQRRKELTKRKKKDLRKRWASLTVSLIRLSASPFLIRVFYYDTRQPNNSVGDLGWTDEAFGYQGWSVVIGIPFWSRRKTCVG